MKILLPDCLALFAFLVMPSQCLGGVWPESNVTAEETAVLYESSSQARGPLSFSVNSRINVVDYDEAWIDYSTPSSIEPQVISFDLDLAGRSPYTRRSLSLTANAVGAKYLPESAFEVDASSAEWIPKDAWFTLKRLLNIAPDGNWRYVLLGDILIVQSRLQIPLRGMAALDIYLAPEDDVVGINLRVADSSGWSLEKLVESSDLQTQEISAGNQKIQRINLRSLLLEHLPGARNPFLKEICVFVRLDRPVDLKRKPVRKIVLQRIADDFSLQGNPKQLLIMQSRTRMLTANIRRMVVQMEGAKKMGDAFVTGGRLSALSPEGNSQPGVEVKRISLVVLGAAPSLPPAPTKQVQPETNLSRLSVNNSLFAKEILSSFLGLLFILFCIFLIRKSGPVMERKSPRIFRILFGAPHRIYFFLAGLLLLPVFFAGLLGRNRAADPAAALACSAMALGVIFMAKDMFFTHKGVD